jgi:uncharacterized protein (TIGR03067 family)
MAREPGPSSKESRNMTSIKRIGGLSIACGLALLALSAALPRYSVAADETPASPALKALEGTWVTSENSDVEAKWVFKGETLEASVNGMDYVGKVKVDEKAKPHPTLDIELSDGPGDVKGKTSRGIYKLDGEKLVITVSMPGLDRPKEFETVPDEAHLFELKKQKKD